MIGCWGRFIQFVQGLAIVDNRVFHRIAMYLFFPSVHVQTEILSASDTDSTDGFHFTGCRRHLSIIMETGRCSACGRFFASEGSFTKHIRKECPMTLRRSRELWKRGILNIAKLNRTRKPKGVPNTFRSDGHMENVEPVDFPQHTDMMDVISEDVNEIGTSDPPPDPPSDQLPEKRTRRPTWKVRESMQDGLPEGPGVLNSLDNTAANNIGPTSPNSGPVSVPNPLQILIKTRTAPNRFVLVREYQRHPSAIPDSLVSWKTLVPGHTNMPPKKHRKVLDIVYPYPNISSFLYNYTWRQMGGVASASNRTHMTAVLTNKQFNTCDLEGVNFPQLEKLIMDDVQSPCGGNGWRRTNVVIEVPTGKKSTAGSRRAERNARVRMQRHDEVDPDADPFPRHKLTISGIRTRSLLHTMIETIQEDLPTGEVHWHGYEEHWQPPYPGFSSERVWGDLYTSDAFLKAECDLLSSQVNPTNPPVIIAYMFWSDSTHLAQFGQAKAWPIYAYIGNQTKYTRCKPSARSARVIGYIPPLPDSFAEELESRGVSPTPLLLAHCRRELFHAVWRLILDPDFLNAYEHGVPLLCSDGILRQVYPRIFTYSADYPEKVLIATIRDMGICPCPRCTIKKESFYTLGTTGDTADRISKARRDNDSFRSIVQEARDNIYRKGYALHSVPGVEHLLKEESFVPTLNAFSHSLKDFNFDIFLTLVVDVMHEFELGVWKALLTHLIRILHSIGANRVQEFNSRFREIVSFGSTIRRFTNNVSDLKKLAARDFEDILQCCIPCFEGLLPAPHDDTVADLLYVATYWHSLAKLRLHSETTLNVLEHVTTIFASLLRHFAQVTCLSFTTVETDHEYNARRRAADRRASKGKAAAPTSVGGKRPKTFNLNTFKLHSLGDYVTTIKMFGTTDSYNTQIGELEHRKTKGRYAQTNKQRFIDQMVNLEVLEDVHGRMYVELTDAEGDTTATTTGTSNQRQCDSLDVTDATGTEDGEENLGNRYSIARDESNGIYLPAFLKDSKIATDPAFKDFTHKLLCHLLARHLQQVTVSDEPDYSNVELAHVHIKQNVIYSHATARVNYTTYDIKRDFDVINCNTGHRDVMLKACDDVPTQHPFWYARVLGIYHANVYFGGSLKNQSQRIDFFFVRWFGHDPDWKGGPAARRLDRIGWVPEHDASGAFGFLNPAYVVRACHLIPAFSEGKTTRLLSPSNMWDSRSGDWVNYYVSRFVDRDMMMRFLGWGIGHLNSPDFPHEANGLIASDEDKVLHTTGVEKVLEAGLEGIGEEGRDDDSSSVDSGDQDAEEYEL